MPYILRLTYKPVRHIGDIVTIDKKKENKLRKLRIAHYAERNPNNWSPREPLSGSCNYPVDPAHVIDRAVLKKNAPKKLPEFSGMYGMGIVSKRIKEAIETLDPEACEFFPFEIFSHDEAESYEYFIMHYLRGEVDCLDYEKSGCEWAPRSNGEMCWWPPRSEIKKVLRKEAIEGLHYWSIKNAAFAVSDELAEMLGDFLPRDAAMDEVDVV